MGKAPAFQLYAADFLVDTMDWTVSQIGAYIRLLLYEWVNGPLPTDMPSLSRIAGISDVRTMYKMWSLKLGKKFIPTTGNLLINKRLELEREKQHNRLKLQSQKGINGARKRWSNTMAHAITQVKPDDSFSSSLIPPMIPQRDEGEICKVPYQEIRKLFIEILPELPRPREENTTWHKECRARWLSYSKAQEEGLDWCRRFFEKIRENPHWLGQNDRGWKPTIGWFWIAKNFWKVIER